MRTLECFAGLSVLGLLGCAGNQEPATTPLAPPPVATVAPAPEAVEVKQEEPKPAPLTGEQESQLYADGWAAYNAKDFNKFQDIWADNATSSPLDMGPSLVGASAIVEQGAKPFAAAFPDRTGEIELTLVNGNIAVGIVLLRGTQTGTYVTPMGPLPATGKRVGFLTAQRVEFNDAGKAVTELMAYDGGTVAGQLGVMPMPHRKVIETGWAEKPVVIASSSDTEKANVAAFGKAVQGFNEHDAASALGSAADDLVFSELSAPADRTGKKESLKGIEEMFKAFPDAKLDVKSVWGAGDYVVATGTWSGTNTGDMGKLKKTGKAVSVGFVEVDKFIAGKTKDIWLFTNGAAAAAQLGMMPPPRTAKSKEGKPRAGKLAATAVAAKPDAPRKAAPAMKPAPPTKTPATPAK